MSKKKKARSRKPKQRQSADPQLPDRRLMDQTMASIHALLEGREFGSIEEMNQYLQEVLAAGGPLPPPPDETPLQKAQTVVYQALEASGAKRVRLARQALAISADCADAYVLLAEEGAHNAAKANGYYAKGVEAGRRALGPEVFANQAGHFWGIVETRPFMRALDGYARTLWLLGNRQASVAHQQEMLRLNPGDNQGIRYFLVHCLLDLQRFDELEQLFAEFDEDISAAMVYPQALAAFLQQGPSAEAGDLLGDALAANPFVPAFLLGEKRLPRGLPATYGLGDESEAHYYVAQYGAFWTRNKPALAWLVETWAETATVDEEDEEEYDWFPAFSVAQFLADNEFPRTEHAAIRRCLAKGLGNYLHEVHGDWRYGKQPVDLLDEYLQIPYLFGIGAVEVIHDPKLRTETKLRVCQHTLENAQLGAEGGVPYGLLALAAFMAAEERMTRDLLSLIATILTFGVSASFFRVDWLEGVTGKEMLTLVDWIAANDEVPAAEKLWWAHQLTNRSERESSTCKRIARRWLDSGALSGAACLTLCHGWLEKADQVGTPPLLWAVNQALIQGKYGDLERLFADAGKELPPELAEIVAEAAAAASDPEPDSLEEFIAASRYLTRTPAFLMRLAIPALVRFGEDLETVVDQYWQRESYDSAALKAGVADAIGEFADRLSPERLRALIERGINHGSAETRKAFYLLSVDFYGNELLERALADNASTLRRWAAKKLGRS